MRTMEPTNSRSLSAEWMTTGMFSKKRCPPHVKSVWEEKEQLKGGDDDADEDDAADEDEDADGACMVSTLTATRLRP